MNKTFSKVLSLGVIFALGLAAVLCCDLSKKVNAAETGSKHCSACLIPHTNKAQTPSQDNGSCCRPKLQAYSLNTVSLNIAPSLTGFTPVILKSEQTIALKTNFNLTFLHGPPGSISDTPLYIDFHNLRI